MGWSFFSGHLLFGCLCGSAVCLFEVCLTEAITISFMVCVLCLYLAVCWFVCLSLACLWFVSLSVS